MDEENGTDPADEDAGTEEDTAEQDDEESSYEEGEGYDQDSGEDGEGPGGDGIGTDSDGGQGYAADDGLSVALGDLVLHPESAQGTHVINVGVHVHNVAGRPIEEGELTLWISAEPRNVETGEDDGNAERGVFLDVPVPALESTGTFPFQLPVQVDPGHWHVTATVQRVMGGGPLATAAGDVVVQGHHARQVDYDEGAKRDLGVVVTHLTRVEQSLYQVHFVLNNLANEPVPAGLPVVGTLVSVVSGMSTSQQYDLPAPIAGAASVQTYLTLEGAPTGTLTATIAVDPNGPSSQEDSLAVQAEEVQGAPHAAAPAHGHDAPAPAGAPTQAHPPASAQVHGGRTSEGSAEEGSDDLDKILTVAHGADTVHELFEIFLGAGEGMSPLGGLLVMITTVKELASAFGAQGEGLKAQGFLFGLLWEVLGRATVQPQMDQSPLGGFGMLSLEERQEAFLEGVTEGRSTASSDLRLHNYIAGSIAYKMAHDHDTESSAALDVLNELARARGISKPLFLDSPTV